MSEAALSRGLAVGCFMLGLGASLAVACGDECECPQLPARPPESGALPIDFVRSDEPDTNAPPVIAPATSPPDLPTAPGIEEGTLAIEGAELVLRYTSEGAQYEVTYEISSSLEP